MNGFVLLFVQSGMAIHDDVYIKNWEVIISSPLCNVDGMSTYRRKYRGSKHHIGGNLGEINRYHDVAVVHRNCWTKNRKRKIVDCQYRTAALANWP